jgi:hypothetical protein
MRETTTRHYAVSTLPCPGCEGVVRRHIATATVTPDTYWGPGDVTGETVNGGWECTGCNAEDFGAEAAAFDAAPVITSGPNSFR